MVVKKRALKRVKQQVSALLRGEDLPEGAQAREVAEVPYQLPPVPSDATECPICQQKYKTHHRLMHHMGVHRGEKFPCQKCGRYHQKNAESTCSCMCTGEEGGLY